MHFPKFWTTAKTGDVVTWGWSDLGLDDALARAKERQQRVLDWLARGGARAQGRYGYPDRPMREEVLREFRAEDGSLAGALSHNAYGCLVLNTAGLVFVDVDAPAPGSGGGLRGLFRRRADDSQTSLEQRLAEQARQWVVAHPEWHWRLYRTKAGVRLMAAHQTVAPHEPAVAEAFETFCADPLYRALCARQRCFRARLTPKPWRCGAAKPPARWPWRDASAERRFREWESSYLSRAAAFATCKLLGQFGGASVAPGFAALVGLHDETTRAASALPLA